MSRLRWPDSTNSVSDDPGTVQVGMPLCRPMGDGLWEIRTNLPTKRTARVLLCLYRKHLVVLHGFIKKTRATPDSDLATARTRQKELER